MTFNYQDVIKDIGGFGRFQKIFFVITFLSAMPNAIPLLMFIFTHYVPEHRCKLDGVNYADLSADQIQSFRSLMYPPSPTEDENFDSCRRYDYNSTQINKLLSRVRMNMSNDLPTTNVSIKCDNGYEFDNTEGLTTAVMTLEMVCDKSWIPSFSNSAIMIGMLLGSCIGKVSDRYGRKPVFFLTTAGQFVFTGFLGFANSIPTYVIICLILGLFTLVNYITLFVIGNELVLARHRYRLGLASFYGFSGGFVFVAFLAYFLQNWRWYLYVSSLIGIVYVPTYWLIPESPRWLIAIGKHDEAKSVLKMVAKFNGKKVDFDDIFDKGISIKEDEEKYLDVKTEGSFWFVFKDKIMRRRLMVVFLQWFVVCIIYYEVTYSISSFTGDRFLNTVIMGLAEIPSFIIAFYLIRWFGCIKTYSIAMLVSGLCCLLLPFVTKGNPYVLNAISLVGKSGANTSFYLVYCLIGEISPTLVRNTSMSVASAIARVGGFFAPHFVYIGQISSLIIPYWIMGGIALVSVALTLYIIPETKGVPLPRNIEDARRNQRIYGIRFWKKFQQEKKEDIL